MGNEIKSVAGAVATAGTAVAAGVTCGQVKELNNAVKDTANFTASNFKESQTFNSATCAVDVAKLAGTTVAAGVTLGQVDALNDAMEDCAQDTA